MVDHSDDDALLDRLVESGMLDEETDGRLALDSDYVETRERYRREIADGDSPSDPRWDEFVGSTATRIDAIEDDVLVDAFAIYATVSSIEPGDAVRAAVAFQRARSASGNPAVPEGFVDLDGRELSGFFNENPRAVIYFYRHDCEPCDRVKEILETLVDAGDIPADVSLAAVYGPESAEIARERYDVAVAPTILFCRDGTVDSRLIGYPEREQIVREIGMIAGEGGI